MKQYFLTIFKATKDYKKNFVICDWVRPKFIFKVQKKILKLFFFDVLTMFFLRPEIYLQMGLFLIFMYFTIILERFATKLHHMQLEP